MNKLFEIHSNGQRVGLIAESSEEAALIAFKDLNGGGDKLIAKYHRGFYTTEELATALKEE